MIFRYNYWVCKHLLKESTDSLDVQGAVKCFEYISVLPQVMGQQLIQHYFDVLSSKEDRYFISYFSFWLLSLGGNSLILELSSQNWQSIIEKAHLKGQYWTLSLCWWVQILLCTVTIVILLTLCWVLVCLPCNPLLEIPLSFRALLMLSGKFLLLERRLLVCLL